MAGDSAPASDALCANPSWTGWLLASGGGIPRLFPCSPLSALGAAVAGFAKNASTARPISRALNLQVFSEQPPTLRLTNPYLQP